MPFNDEIFIKLRELKTTMTPVEQRISNYILKNKERVPRLSVKNLAGGSQTSEASVVRFCKQLGYRSYRDFIVGVSATLGSNSKDHDDYAAICPGDNMQMILRTVSMNNCKSINDTMRLIDHSALRQAVELLRQAGRIDFYGVGASGLVCMDAQQKFTRIGKICFAYTDAHSQLTAASILSKNDVVVLVSNSGETVDILDTLEVVKKSGAATVAITRYAKSELASAVDIVLAISTPESTVRSGAMGSRIAMLNVIDILFACVVNDDYGKVRKHLMETRNVLLRKRKHEESPQD